MLVMKFGGTSLATAERMKAAAGLVVERARRADGGPLVVVSALAGVTNLLVAGIESALAGDANDARNSAETFRSRHLETLAALDVSGAAASDLTDAIEKDTAELERLYSGIAALGEATPRTRDAVLCRGDLLSSRLFAAVVASHHDSVEWIDAREIVATDQTFGHAMPDAAEVRARFAATVLPAVERGRIPVLAGFVGSTRGGQPTTLGRGGSDYTATLAGVALSAREVQIWTDVDGMMTADPRVVPGARVLDEVPYDEAAELAYFGAKVLHPATIRPAIEAGIPVRIRNTLRPEAPGTRVAAPSGGRAGFTAVASKSGITLVTLSSPRMLMAYGVLARIFTAFERHRTAVDLVTTSEVSVSLTIDDASRLEEIAEELSAHFQIRRVGGCAIVSLVGRGVLTRHGLAADVFTAVRDLNVLMVAVGASDINMSFVVRESDAPSAVRSLHAAFFESGEASA